MTTSLLELEMANISHSQSDVKLRNWPLRGQALHTWREKAASEEDDVDITWIYQEQFVFN